MVFLKVLSGETVFLWTLRFRRDLNLMFGSFIIAIFLLNKNGPRELSIAQQIRRQ